MFTADEQNLIDKVFDGDKHAFLAAHAKGRRKMKSWDDIMAAVKVYPEYEVDAFELIIGLLGYLPPSEITLPHESALRALIHSHKMGGLTFNQLLLQATEHVKLIRNADVKSHRCISYDREIYKKYFDYLPGCADAVKARLTRFLGYEPKIEHSVVVEILMREDMKNGLEFPDKLTIRDIQVVTVIKYREVLLSEGLNVANRSPLFVKTTVRHNKAWSV